MQRGDIYVVVFPCCGGCVVGACTSSVVWLGLVLVVLCCSCCVVRVVCVVMSFMLCWYCSSFFVQLGGNIGV